jgi:hypothetical protein
LSGRWIDDQIPRASQRTTASFRVVPRLSLGVEYNPRADDASPLANWVALTETGLRPALILGTSSDRIGTPRGHAYYATLSKDLGSVNGWPIAPYAGVAWGTYEDELRAIAGARARLGRGFSSTVIFDGEEVHPTLEYRFLERHVVTLLWVATETTGLAYSIAF